MSAPPVDDIEITPEMLDAGANVLSELVVDMADGWVSPREAAEAVYLTMQKACRTRHQE